MNETVNSLNETVIQKKNEKPKVTLRFFTFEVEEILISAY